MTTLALGPPGLDAPFPGLRSFEADEALLFCGREGQVTELLERLGNSRFVAVTGTSGSGKSSLVRAGLRPALHRGYLLDTTSHWRFLTMRPGSAPIDALAQGLAEALQRQDHDAILAALRASSDGLTNVVRTSELAAGESVLLIADQFEELFRYDVTRDQEADAALFVSHLLQATEQRSVPIYVVVTMRSEFLGRCSEFSGLAEAFNRSQYLVPRLTRDERREAIERPLRLFGITPAPALVQQVLNDAGDAPDQLPSLQHALLRTFREWQRVGDTPRLEPKYYEVVGGIERAIQNHGEEVLASLDSTGRQVVEKVFRALTVTQGGVSLRRPRTLETLYAVVGASTPEQRAAVDHVVAVFGERANSFLTTSTTRLTPQTVVDITHESLLRRWSRLREWMREESRSAEWYADATRDVARHARGEVGLWRDPELTGILKRRESEGWNDTWANQYRQESDPPFPEVMSFLAASHAREQERLHAEQELRDRELQQTRALAAAKRRQTVILALLLAGVAGAGLLAYRLVLKDRELARTSASIVNLSQQRDTANSRVGQLEQEKTDLEKRTSSSSATTADTAQLERLNAQIQAAKAEANARQDEIAKLRKDQELGSSDRGALLSRIDALQGQLTQASADRDKLKSQSDDYVQQLARQKTQLDEANREIARLKEIASSGTPVTGSPIVPDSINASSQDVVRAFTNGVRSYELGDWQKAADSMREAIRLQSAARQVPREARMSGTRYVPYAPQSYLGAALFELKSSCQLLNPVLAAANQETPPGDVRTKIQTARRQCGAQP